MALPRSCVTVDASTPANRSTERLMALPASRYTRRPHLGENVMSKQDDQCLNDASTDQPVAPSATGLGALFAAAGKQAGKTNSPRQGKAGFDPHTKRVHMPPRGTRRSMGKR